MTGQPRNGETRMAWQLEKVNALFFGVKMVMKIGFICEKTNGSVETNELTNVNYIKHMMYTNINIYTQILQQLKHECVCAHCKYNIEHQHTKTK